MGFMFIPNLKFIPFPAVAESKRIKLSTDLNPAYLDFWHSLHLNSTQNEIQTLRGPQTLKFPDIWFAENKTQMAATCLFVCDPITTWMTSDHVFEFNSSYVVCSCKYSMLSFSKFLCRIVSKRKQLVSSPLPIVLLIRLKFLIVNNQ